MFFFRTTGSFSINLGLKLPCSRGFVQMKAINFFKGDDNETTKKSYCHLKKNYWAYLSQTWQKAPFGPGNSSLFQ